MRHFDVTIIVTCQFPQECMLRDRASAWHSTYSSPNFQEAVEYEMNNSLDVIAQVNCFILNIFGSLKCRGMSIIV